MWLWLAFSFSLKIHGGVCLFMCLLATSILFLERYLFKFFPILKFRLVIFLLSNCISIFSRVIDFYQIYSANDLSHYVDCLFTFLIMSFDAQNYWLILMKSHLSNFSFVAFAFGVVSKKLLPRARSWRCTPLLSFKSFIVLTFLGLWYI